MEIGLKEIFGRQERDFLQGSVVPEGRADWDFGQELFSGWAGAGMGNPNRNSSTIF